MIEIVEANVFSKQLKDTLSGKTITGCLVDTSPHKFALYYSDKSKYLRMLQGKKITGCEPNGGQIEIYAEDARILLSDGANIRYLEKDEAHSDKHQLLLTFDDLSKLFVTIRMYGAIQVYKENENKWEYYLVQKSKPNVLSDEFDLAYFKKLLEETDPKYSVKALLSTEQRIPGLGNGTLQDILFDARINPKTKLKSLNASDVDTLFYSIKNTLSDMIYKGGRNTETDIFGKSGNYSTIMSNKNYDRPCINCGSMIIREAYLGGNIYYCPVCQPLERK